MIKGGMGPDVRRVLREKLALKLMVFHSCDTHDCKTHGNRSGVKNVDLEEDPFRVTRQPSNRAKLDRPKEEKEKVDPRFAVRKKNIEKKGWEVYGPERRGDLRGKDLTVSKTKRVWLSRDELMARRGPGGMTAIEKIDRDLHGMVVERGGQYLDPFATGHVAYRLEMFDLAGEMLDGGSLAKTAKGQDAFSVEMKKPEVMPNGTRRQPNYIYPVGSKAALNLVVQPNGNVAAAFMEFADGSYANPHNVRESLEEDGRKLGTSIIATTDFGGSGGSRPKRRRR